VAYKAGAIGIPFYTVIDTKTLDCVMCFLATVQYDRKKIAIAEIFMDNKIADVRQINTDECR
jgi:hypothetical protein